MGRKLSHVFKNPSDILRDFSTPVPRCFDSELEFNIYCIFAVTHPSKPYRSQGPHGVQLRQRLAWFPEIFDSDSVASRATLFSRG